MRLRYDSVIATAYELNLVDATIQKGSQEEAAYKAAVNTFSIKLDAQIRINEPTSGIRRISSVVEAPNLTRLTNNLIAIT